MAPRSELSIPSAGQKDRRLSGDENVREKMKIYSDIFEENPFRARGSTGSRLLKPMFFPSGVSSFSQILRRERTSRSLRKELLLL